MADAKRNGHFACLVVVVSVQIILACLTASAKANDQMNAPSAFGGTAYPLVYPAVKPDGLGGWVAALPVRFYQEFLGPQWGNKCSHWPSCSQYSLLCVKKHGIFTGFVMTFDRLQHEANEARYSPLIKIGKETKVYDPVANNDFWWFRQ